ncbi:M50 family metallopeptidase [Amycolatopsis sp. WQ 127309]|uniref:M50 family metallopeptidase n=1 Tax=Amycolatopsis sp. WQ 127309 TaxID=2932773 RepID=UPI001FF1B2C4|nr:M50 family metallopeptidase [Amycolatopsis sp. WQ 127309]UOZ06284.1 M50 family metallopeptidase [Amycolatopsis sp. WQ 127309]
MASAFAVLNETVPLPGPELVGITALVAVVAVVTAFAVPASGRRSVFYRANFLGTLFHEGGHALVSVLTGGGVFRIEIDSPESGGTWHWNPSPFARVLATAAGYAMPPLAGLGAAALLHRGLSPAVLLLTLVTMLFILLVTRDMLTFVVVVAVGAVMFGALRWAPPWLKNGIAYAEAWLLLTSEIGGLRALLANRFAGGFRGQEDDAASVAERTGIPSLVWIAAWFALIGWAVWHAFPLLWHL